jgi:hypothetical protein
VIGGSEGWTVFVIYYPRRRNPGRSDSRSAAIFESPVDTSLLW